MKTCGARLCHLEKRDPEKLETESHHWGDVSEGLLLFAAEREQLPGFDSNER